MFDLTEIIEQLKTIIEMIFKSGLNKFSFDADEYYVEVEKKDNVINLKIEKIIEDDARR